MMSSVYVWICVVIYKYYLLYYILISHMSVAKLCAEISDDLDETWVYGINCYIPRGKESTEVRNSQNKGKAIFACVHKHLLSSD